jgi:hypothetical protein
VQGRRVPRTLLVAIVLLLAPLPRAGAQTLRDRVENLFRFGHCGPDILLCLQNTSGQDAALAFSDALEAGNRLLVDFVADAIGLSVASIPTPATAPAPWPSSRPAAGSRPAGLAARGRIRGRSR